MTVRYREENVLDAARQRIAAVFDEFERIVVSVSGGKDSTVLHHLALEEALRRGRRLTVFFLDQEAEYESTIEVIRAQMHDPRIDPLWVQVPIRMTNATSHREAFLHAWEPGAEWMRAKDPVAVHEMEGAPDRFYDFFAWLEAKAAVPTAYLVGLRSRESLNRFRSVTKSAGHRDWTWTTKTASPNCIRAYPIYDWTFGDVWKYIADHELPYNRLYDRMFARHGVNVSRMRVSNLIHEVAFRCLVDLQEYEPETYERLVRRLSGVHCAALYGREGSVYDARDLPPGFDSWRAYRAHLLETTPTEYADRYRRRFAGQAEDEATARQQCKQLLINDWENNVPVRSPKRAQLRDRYWDLL